MGEISRRGFLTAAGSLTLGACLPAYAAARTTPSRGFHITALDIPPGERGESVLGLNDHGQIIGVTGQRAFLWDRGRLHFLDSLPGTAYLSPRAINNAAQVVGTAFAQDFVRRRAFLWENGKTHDLGAPPDENSEATCINDRGDVIGKSYSSQIRNRVEHRVEYSYNFIWNERTGFHRLNAPLDERSDGLAAINNAGQITGDSTALGVAEKTAKMAALPPDRRPYEGDLIPGAAFIWQNGVAQSLKLTEAWASGGADINDRGAIVGRMSLYPDTGEVVASSPEKSETILQRLKHSHHFFLWKNGRMTDLGETGPDYTQTLLTINGNEDIVGSVFVTPAPADPRTDPRRAFLWREGERHLLEGLLPTASGWTLAAACINNPGQIAGNGRHEGQRRAFLLTPIP